MEKALGLIETVGKAAAIEAADAAVKAADVFLVGIENSSGNGRMTVKLTGEVSAVKAAVEAAAVHVEHTDGTVFAQKVIARPSDELARMLQETIGYRNETRWHPVEESEEISTKILEEMPEIKVTCNLCGDPSCLRTRGEARTKCIHYHKLIKK